ncbi:MAG: hypothetical protein F6J86_16735 [Symploca sp. SIO1B1]|nr:hypothetical protein [Symploca sp. SIO1B1]
MNSGYTASLEKLVKNYFIWDCWVHKEVQANQIPVYHIYHLQAPRFQQDGSPYHPEARHNMASVGHITATDLFDQSTWESLGTCFAPDTGNEDSPYNLAIWTGSMMPIEHPHLQKSLGASYVMAITGRTTKDEGLVQRLFFLISEDAYNWKILLNSKEQICQLDLGLINHPAYDWAREFWDNKEHLVLHCRDPKIMSHPNQEGAYLILFTSYRAEAETREFTNGCVGVATSTDLINWEVQPPLRTPKILGKMELPQLVKSRDDWYLLVSCENNIENKEYLESLNVRYDSGGYAFRLQSAVDKQPGYLDLEGAWEYAGYWGGAGNQDGTPNLYAPTVADVITKEDNTTEVILIAWYGYTQDSKDREFQGTYKVYTVQLAQE